MEAWWNVWDRACQHELETYDLGWATIHHGRSAVVCWQPEDVLRVIIDRPLAEALIDRDEGFLIVAWIQEAVQRFRENDAVGIVRIPREWRKLRQQWLRGHAGVAS